MCSQKHLNWLLVVFALISPLSAAEILRLTPETWDKAVPGGKEVDAIYGDYVLRNQHLVAVVANAVSGRHANTTVTKVGGAIIDLTTRGQSPQEESDQLSAFYPNGRDQFAYRQIKIVRAGGEEVSLRVTAAGGVDRPEANVTYRLTDTSDFIWVESEFVNRSDRQLTVELLDEVRADRSFDKVTDGITDLFWAYDKWFGQAYGIQPERGSIESSGDARNRLSSLRYLIDGQDRFDLAPGETRTLVRRIFPARHLVAVKAIASRIREQPMGTAQVRVSEQDGTSVSDADVEIFSGGTSQGYGRTDDKGEMLLELPPGTYQAKVSSLGRGSRDVSAAVPSGTSATASPIHVVLPKAARVQARIRDEQGGPIPCKVEFHGIDGTPNPELGPHSGSFSVGNLRYSASGQWSQAIPPGRYQVLISHGPEYDAEYQTVEVPPSGEVQLEATLRRVVQSSGWVSTDFHSHSSPSGDNTASQLGRVLNILAEHIEFAPCTEHNRLSTYTPHLKQLGAEHLLATCVGIELSGRPGSLNHQNAFPIVLKPRTQDNGGPVIHTDPAEQIRRLALWDDGADKLVQVNHPDLGEMFFDRDADGDPDGGLKGMFQYIDVLEVHPHYVGTYRGGGGDTLSLPPTFSYRGQVLNNRIFNWLQLLNQGHRIPGVVNTDAHYNFHGSGWIRNYVRSPTDDPSQIKAVDIVRASEAGNIVMSNGPFMEVSLKATGSAGDGREVIPGEDLSLPGGEALLKVRVQCANWLDIDRVQVLVNGRPDETLNFTRWTHPGYFGSGVIKFDRKFPLQLEGDAHIIVAAVGENSTLGPVVGPVLSQAKPAAISNPIFVDMDGGGFEPNGDTLDSPLPVKSGARSAR